MKVVHFPSDFGHQATLAAGFQHALGSAVLVLDANPQDPPELTPELVERWRKGLRVAHAQRRNRDRKGPVRRGATFLLYRTLKRVTRFEIPAGTGDFYLIDRTVVDPLNAKPGRNRYVRGLRAWDWFRQTAAPFGRPPRYAEEPKYTFAGSLVLVVNRILALSKYPLRVGTYFGLLVSVARFLLTLWYIVPRCGVRGTRSGREEFRGGLAE